MGGVLHGGRGAAVEGGVSAGRGPPAERLFPAPLSAGLYRVYSCTVLQYGAHLADHRLLAHYAVARVAGVHSAVLEMPARQVNLRQISQ